MASTDKPTRAGTTATAAMVVAGLAALGVSAWQGYGTATFLGQASRAAGTVVDRSGRPVIRFVTEGGAAVEFGQSGFVIRPIGAAVPVAYEPHDPAGTARPATFWALWGGALWLLPTGLGFTLLPLFGAKAAWRLGRW